MILTRAHRRRLEAIARGRSDEGLHLLEGPKAILDALAAGVVAELWMCDALEPEKRAALEELARERGVPVGEGAARDLERLAGTVNPQGALALVRDTALPLDDLLARGGLLLWIDGVQDPGNVGAVLRVAAAFGCAGVLVSEGSADPLGLKALRASTGLALGVPFARAPARRIADALASRGRPVWVLERGGGDLFALEAVPPDLVLVAGGEGAGAGDAARAVAGRSLGIPLAPGVDSLNAAVATGIATAWLARRLA